MKALPPFQPCLKRQFIVAFAFYGKENLIYCIEKKDFRLVDKKHTPANDIVLKLK